MRLSFLTMINEELRPKCAEFNTEPTNNYFFQLYWQAVNLGGGAAAGVGFLTPKCSKQLICPPLVASSPPPFSDLYRNILRLELHPKMDFLSAHACVFLSKTRKFSVLEVRQEPKVSPSKDATTPKFPCLSLSDVLTQSSDTSEELKLCLSHHGYVILTYPDNSPYSKIIDSLSNTITDDFLPPSKSHESRAGGEIYVSERDVPMWKLGYERCDDVREAYRVHCGDPDRQPWPSGLARKSLLRGLCLCRHVCDAALEMTLVDAGWAKERFRGGGKSSYGSKTGYWNKEEGDLPPREGDVSVFYSMLYYNDEDAVKFQKKEDIFGLTDGMRLNVKEVSVRFAVFTLSWQDERRCDGDVNVIFLGSVLTSSDAACRP